MEKHLNWSPACLIEFSFWCMLAWLIWIYTSPQNATCKICMCVCMYGRQSVWQMHIWICDTNAIIFTKGIFASSLRCHNRYYLSDNFELFFATWYHVFEQEELWNPYYHWQDNFMCHVVVKSIILYEVPSHVLCKHCSGAWSYRKSCTAMASGSQWESLTQLFAQETTLCRIHCHWLWRKIGCVQTIIWHSVCKVLCRYWRYILTQRKCDSMMEARGIDKSSALLYCRHGNVVGLQLSHSGSTWPVMCRGVGQASHITLPLSTQQWWVPGGTRKLNCNDWL